MEPRTACWSRERFLTSQDHLRQLLKEKDERKKKLIQTISQQKVSQSTLIKKQNKIFLISKEIQKGPVAKSYMTNGLPTWVNFCAFCHIRIRKPFLIYDFAHDLIRISLYKKILFSFLSVYLNIAQIYHHSALTA
jgi:hypothetical protein